ncbi:MAG TPA: RHS repeat-associated core domain-containing protein, partial [Candidatus Thermoplasmatota archaeon]|nr:RHS repeat-associated core domain-containing protein [Candidatus Thermoplasmatota archaeon]
LHYYRARYYDSNAGRFVSRDPIGVRGDGINLGNPYAYVGGMPLDAKDSTGEWLQFVAGGGIGCAIGGGISLWKGGSLRNAGKACAVGAAAGLLIATGNPYAAGAGLGIMSQLMGDAWNDGRVNDNFEDYLVSAAWGVAGGGMAAAGGLGVRALAQAGRPVLARGASWATGASASGISDAGLQFTRINILETQCDWDEMESIAAFGLGGVGGRLGLGRAAAKATSFAREAGKRAHDIPDDVWARSARLATYAEAGFGLASSNVHGGRLCGD